MKKLNKIYGVYFFVLLSFVFLYQPHTSAEENQPANFELPAIFSDEEIEIPGSFPELILFPELIDYLSSFDADIWIKHLRGSQTQFTPPDLKQVLKLRALVNLLIDRLGASTWGGSVKNKFENLSSEELRSFIKNLLLFAQLDIIEPAERKIDDAQEPISVMASIQQYMHPGAKRMAYLPELRRVFFRTAASFDKKKRAELSFAEFFTEAYPGAEIEALRQYDLKESFEAMLVEVHIAGFIKKYGIGQLLRFLVKFKSTGSTDESTKINALVFVGSRSNVERSMLAAYFLDESKVSLLLAAFNEQNFDDWELRQLFFVLFGNFVDILKLEYSSLKEKSEVEVEQITWVAKKLYALIELYFPTDLVVGQLEDGLKHSFSDIDNDEKKEIARRIIRGHKLGDFSKHTEVVERADFEDFRYGRITGFSKVNIGDLIYFELNSEVGSAYRVHFISQQDWSEFLKSWAASIEESASACEDEMGG